MRRCKRYRTDPENETDNFYSSELQDIQIDCQMDLHTQATLFTSHFISSVLRPYLCLLAYWRTTLQCVLSWANVRQLLILNDRKSAWMSLIYRAFFISFDMHNDDLEPKSTEACCCHFGISSNVSDAADGVEIIGCVHKLWMASVVSVVHASRFRVGSRFGLGFVWSRTTTSWDGSQAAPNGYTRIQLIYGSVARYMENLDSKMSGFKPNFCNRFRAASFYKRFCSIDIKFGHKVNTKFNYRPLFPIDFEKGHDVLENVQADSQSCKKIKVLA